MGRMDSPDTRLIQTSVGVQPPSRVGVVPNFPLGMTHMDDTMSVNGRHLSPGVRVQGLHQGILNPTLIWYLIHLSSLGIGECIQSLQCPSREDEPRSSR